MTNVLTVTIANTAYTITDNSLKVPQKIDQAGTCDFVLVDNAGTALFGKGQPVSVVDSVLGTLFTGYVATAKALNLYPNPHIQWAISCTDQTTLPSQRTSNSLYNTQPAAVILTDQLENILSAEDMTGAYALDYNHYLTDWTNGAATLTNVAATTNNGDGNFGDGDLELLPAGSPLVYTDDFTKGTFTNVSLVNGNLGLSSTPGLQLLGTAVQAPGGTGNAYVYIKVWGGSSGISSGDKLQYDVWISSTSPQQKAAVDFICTDGTTLRDNGVGIYDQNGIAPHPGNDLSGFATDAWYSRTFDLSGLAGKTIASVQVALEGDTNGAYAAYFRKIKTTNGGNLKQAFYTTSLQTNAITNLSAYVNISLIACTVYEMSGTRTAPTLSLNTLNIPQSSSIDWVPPAIVSSLAPTVPSTNKTLPTVVVQTSIDNGASWQTCTNYSAIPSILAGMSMNGRSLLLREVFTMLGTDPTLTPTLAGLTLTIQPSYNATKTDVIQTEDTNANWNAGTLTNVVAAGGSLMLNEIAQNWNVGPLSGQTLYGSNSPTQTLAAGLITIGSNASSTSDARSRLDFAGQWQDFIAEIDLALGATVAATHQGLVYRTTGWSNTENTFAWKAWYNPGAPASMNLGYGTDGGSNSYTSVASVPITLSTGTTHRMKVVANGSSHKIYLDGALIINVTDSHYVQSGYLGLAYYNNAADGLKHSANFDNFGVCQSLTGTWQSVTQSLSAAGTYGGSVIQWQAALDTTNTTSLVIQTSVDGGATWQVCTNGAAIPNLALGQSLSGVNLEIQALFTSPSANLTPVLQGLTAWVLGGFSASGTWQTTPLGNDTFVRANQSGFGTSWDGQSYVQNGTGTAAIVGNEGQISATTGDVEMILGSNSAGDEDGSVRFSLSNTTMEAGMELRRVDASDWWRLYATTTQLVLVQNVAGVMTTLATASIALATLTYYRMRFRIVGGGPVNVYGRVWQDGTSEPQNWNGGITYVQ